MTSEDHSAASLVSCQDLSSLASFELETDGGREHEHRIVRPPVSFGPMMEQLAGHRAWKQRRKPKSIFKSWTETLDPHDYFVGRLRNAAVQGKFCYVRTAEGPFIKESVWPMDAAESERLFQASAPADPPRGSEGFLVGGDLISNYYHWIIQSLPALEFYPRSGAGEPCKLVMGAPKVWQMRTLELAGFSRDDLDVTPPDQIRTYDILHYPYSSVGQFHGLRRGMRSFFDGMVARAQRSGDADLLLYVSRRDTHRRPMRNEAELEAALIARGFTVIRAGELTVDGQIEAFNRARIVVGPHSAGLANIAFCRPGTPIYELYPSHYAFAHCFRVAQALDLPYWGDCFAAETSEDTDRTLIGWSVDLPYVLGRVDECMAFHSVPAAESSSPAPRERSVRGS